MSRLSSLAHFRPRTLLDSFLTYPRFVGALKPELLSRSAAETQARLRGLSEAWWPKELQVQNDKRILVISPHPDDESIGAGGFLLRHRGKSEIHLMNVFTGDSGGQLISEPYQNSPDYKCRLMIARKAESSEIARRLQAASLLHLDLADGPAALNMRAAARLRSAIDHINPDILLLPWFLDRQNEHRIANVLFSWGCEGLTAMVLSFEIWEMLQPNAIIDIAGVFEEKLELIRCYRTQIATIDYVGMCQGLAKTRAFYNPVQPNRGGAVEAFFALPTPDYCELVRSIYGEPGQLSSQGRILIS